MESVLKLLILLSVVVSFTVSFNQAFAQKTGEKTNRIKQKNTAGTSVNELIKSNVLIVNSNSTGSGFFISKGLIVTNYHVIEGLVDNEQGNNDTAAIIRMQNGQLNMAKVLVTDKANDLAILKSFVNNGTPLILGKASDIKLTNEIIVIGSPQALQGTVSTGIISAKRKDFEGFKNVVQISAPVSSGSSGSPVISKKTHKVLGVVNMVHKGGQNLNFFIPVDKLRKLIKTNIALLKKDKKSYVSSLFSKAKSGNKNNQFELGFMYYLGLNIKKNYNQSRYWFLKSKNKKAYPYLGSLYFTGDQYLDKNYKLAKKYLLLSSEEALSARLLGFMYLGGHGFDKNYDKALKYLTKAAKKYDLPAQKMLGILFTKNKNIEEAALWLMISSVRDPGDKKIAELMKLVLANLTDGQSQRIKQRIAALVKQEAKNSKAIAQNHPLPSRSPSSAPSSTQPKGSNRELQSELQSAEELKKTCDGGDIEACFNLGIIEEGKGNFTAAQIYYKKACDGRDMEACFNLGLLEDDEGNLAAAKIYYKKACDGGGTMMACTNLGILEYKKGNISLARSILNKSCNQGHNLSCQALVDLQKNKNQ